MKVLRWCGRHKIWAFWICAFIIGGIVGVFPILNPFQSGYDLGRVIGIIFIPYWAAVWISSKTKKVPNVKTSLEVK